MRWGNLLQIQNPSPDWRHSQLNSEKKASNNKPTYTLVLLSSSLRLTPRDKYHAGSGSSANSVCDTEAVKLSEQRNSPILVRLIRWVKLFKFIRLQRVLLSICICRIILCCSADYIVIVLYNEDFCSKFSLSRSISFYY